MKFDFDLQRFATTADGTVTLLPNETFTLDDVDYKAGASGAVLKAETSVTYTVIDGQQVDIYEATAITGIKSGEVVATLSGVTDSPEITFDGSTAFEFTCTGNDDGALNVGYGNSSFNYMSGNLTYSAAGLNLPKGTIVFAGTLLELLPFNVTMEVPSSGATIAYNSSGGAEFTSTEKLSSNLTFPDGVAEFLETIKPQLPEFLKTLGIEITAEQVDTLYDIVLPIVQDSLELAFTGTINYTSSPINISFGENTTTDVTIGERTISFETVDDAAGIGFTFADGVLTITPGNNDGTLNIALKNGDTTTFSGNLEIAGGSILVDVLNQKVSVAAGTTTTVTLSDDIAGAGGRSITISADQDTGFNLALDETGNKLTLTPADENPLHLQLKNGDAVILDRDIALTGSVVIGMDDNTFTVTQGTALTITGETGDTTVSTTVTATGDAGITLAVDADGVLTLTPGENDGSLNITRKRDGTTTLFDFDLNVSGGSMSFDPTGGKFTVAEDTTLEIINNQSGSYTSMTIEGGNASCTLTTNSDGTLALNVDSGDGKLHFLHKHDDTTIFDNELELSGKFTFDATDNTITAADGTKLAVAFGNRELTASVNGDAGFGISVDSGIIKLTPGENDGSIDLKLTNGDRTVFEGNVAVSGGGMEINLSEQTLTFDKGVAATITMGDRVFVYSLPNGATQTIIIDDDGKINLTFEDSEPLHIKYTKGTTTILDVDITIDGTVTFDPNANSVSIAKDTTATVAYADGRTATFTALDDAGITASMDDDGKIRLATNDDNGEINVTLTNKDGSTVLDTDIELTGAIVLDATNQKIYAEAGTTLTISNNQVDIVTELSVDEDAGFTFAFDGDSGKVTITPEDGDGKLTLTRIRDGGERVFSTDVEISGGSIIFDSSNNSLSVTEGTKTAITVGDYTLELTVTDAAGITASIDDDGKFVVSAEEGDGELVFTLKKGDIVLNTGSVEFDGTIELDPDNQTLGLTKDSSATFTLGNYKYSITANADATIALSNDLGAITVTAPDGDGSLDIALTAGDQTVFAGNVEFTGSFTVDPVNQKISLSEDSQTKITVGNYTVSLAVTDAASVGFAIGNGTITLTATEGDGKATIDLLKGGSSLISGEVELDGEITLDIAGQKVSVAKDTTLTLTRNEITTSITATDDAGFTIANDGGKLTITPGEGDGKLQITRTQGTDTFSAELEINGSITYDTANNQLALTKGTTTTVTIGEYTVELTATDDAGVNIAIDGDKVTITPQGDGGSTHVKVTNGGKLLLDNTIGLSNGSVTVSITDQQVTVAEGTKLSVDNGDATINLTAKADAVVSVETICARKSKDSPQRTLYFTIEGDSADFDVAIERGGAQVFGGTASIGGVISYRASTNTFALTGSNSSLNDKDSFIKFDIGDYTFTAATDGQSAINSFTVSEDGKINLNFPNEEFNGLKITVDKSGEQLFSGYVNVDGSLSYDAVNNQFIVPADTITTVTIGDYSAVLSVDDEAGFTINADSGKVTVTPRNNDGKLNFFVSSSEAPIIGGSLEITNGSIVFDNTSRTISVTKGTTTTVTIGDYSIALTANDDAGVNIGLDGGKLTITPQDGDGSIDVVYSEGGQVAFKNNVEISGGSITVDALNNSVGLTKGTTITLANFNGSDSDTVSFTALDDANITLSVAEGGGLRIEPESGDGDLQLSVTRDDVTRTATLGIEGAIVYQRGGNISLEEGTTVDIVWEDDYELAITSNGSSGTIAFDADKGLGITSADDKLDLKLTNPAGVTFTLEGIQGTLWYNSGQVLIEEGSTLTTTWTGPAGLATDMEVLAVDDDAYIEFESAGMTFGSDAGTAEVSFKVNGAESTINVTDGAITFERTTTSRNFVIAEGTTLSTNFASSIMSFTTGDAGTYVINGHEFVTTVDGVKLTASGDAFVFAVSEDVTCDDLTFGGKGNISITAGGEHLYDPGVYIESDDLITKDTSTEDIIDKVTAGVDYGDTVTAEELAEMIDEDAEELYENLSVKLDDDTENKMQDVDFSDYTGKKNVTLEGNQNQSVEFNDEGFNVAVVDEDARNHKDITLGDGGDLAIVEDTPAQVNIAAGSGNDTIVSKGDNVTVDLGDGKTDLFPVDGKMTLEGYDASTGSGFGTTTQDIEVAVEKGFIDYDDGKLSIGSAVVTFDDDEPSKIVNFYDRDGDLQKVGFAVEDDVLDASDEKGDLVLVADEYSSIKGGSGNDTVLADVGAVVNAGTGNNLIILPEERGNDEGATIVLGGGGRNTVENFNATFDNDGDKVYVDANDLDITFDGDDISIKSNGSRALLTDVEGTSFVNSFDDYINYAEFLAQIDDKEYKIAVAAEGAFIDASDPEADAYIGDKSGINFGDSNENIYVNLGQQTGSVEGDEIFVKGINSLVGGKGMHTLVGSDGKDTLIAGFGDASIWGGAGDDYMQGSAGFDAKNGSTAFYFMAGDGHDTIGNMEFFDGDNYPTADEIRMDVNQVTNAVVDVEGNVHLQLNDGEDWLAIEDAAGEKFMLNGCVVEIDKNDVAYDDDVDCFIATAPRATLTVDGEADVWLDGSGGQIFIGDFEVIDASNSDGTNVLAGNNLSNTIIAGDGDASLWGGDEGDDLLIGGDGKNTFYYRAGDGNDTITGTNDGDVIALYNITLDDIDLTTSEITADAIKFNFKNGQTLTVEGSTATEIAIDGATFVADHETPGFKQK